MRKRRRKERERHLTEWTMNLCSTKKTSRTMTRKSKQSTPFHRKRRERWGLFLSLSPSLPHYISFLLFISPNASLAELLKTNSFVKMIWNDFCWRLRKKRKEKNRKKMKRRRKKKRRMVR
jgi:hypothetical protein